MTFQETIDKIKQDNAAKKRWSRSAVEKKQATRKARGESDPTLFNPKKYDCWLCPSRLKFPD